MLDDKPLLRQRVDIAAERAVLLDDTFRQPVGNALAFSLVAVYRPGFLPVAVVQPALLRRGGVDRVLGGEDELPAGFQRGVNRGEQGGQILEVVQGQRAVDQIVTFRRQLQLRQILPTVLDARVGGHLPRLGQHLFRDVQPQHAGCALFARAAAEPAVAAAEIDHAFALQIRQDAADGGPFRRAVQAVLRAAELRIAVEKGLIVIDVLRHDDSLVNDGGGMPLPYPAYCCIILR